MIYALGDKKPQISDNCFIAPNAAVIGDVVIEKGASVWFGVTIRADNDRITVGAGSNIQDGSVLHVDPGKPLVIGKNVTVGHKAMLHGGHIGDDTLIGINAVVLSDTVIGEGCIIGANALVTQGMNVPDGAMVLGSPGKVVKNVSDEVRQVLLQSAIGYQQEASHFNEQLVPIG